MNNINNSWSFNSSVYLFLIGGDYNNNNNNNCLKSNIQCIEIRVQWTVHLGSSHMHVHAVTRVHAVTPKLVICVMYLTSIWRILLMTDCLNAVWSNDRAAHTDTNPKNLELAPPQSITATRLDQLVYSPNYYIQIFQTQNNCPQWEANLHPARSESWADYSKYEHNLQWEPNENGWKHNLNNSVGIAIQILLLTCGDPILWLFFLGSWNVPFSIYFNQNKY